VRPGSLEENVAEASQVLLDLEALGISMQTVTDELEQEGVQSFADAFTALLSAVEASRKAAVTSF